MDRRSHDLDDSLAGLPREFLDVLSQPAVQETSAAEREAIVAAVLSGKGKAATRPKLVASVGRGTRQHRSWPWISAAVAAGAAIVIVIGVGNFSSHPRTEATAWQELTTGPGQRASMQLADGSAVTLAPQSKLRYSPQFGGAVRDVYLEGQALFTVVSHTEIPFVVHTDGAETQVLGTSFVVRRYASDSAVSVIVAQGRVSLNQTVVGNGEMGTARGNGAVDVTREISIPAALAWTEGRLEFRDTPAEEIAHELGRWYGIAVEFRKESTARRKISMSLSTETAREAIGVFAALLGADVKVQGYTAILY